MRSTDRTPSNESIFGYTLYRLCFIGKNNDQLVRGVERVSTWQIIILIDVGVDYHALIESSFSPSGYFVPYI
jgi:hypothetical protein